MTKLISVGSAVAALALAAAPQVQAETATFEPARDNTLYETTDGSLSNGAGDWVFVGQTAASEARRAVLAFDVAGQIPAGSTINSAELVLFMDRTQAPSTDVTVHQLLSDWGEGTSNADAQEGGGAAATTDDATWLHTFFPDEFWSSDGGDFEPVASASTSVGDIGSYSWSSEGLAADVQDWVDDPTANFGWILLGDESVAATAKRFASRENPDLASRPLLIVDYTAGTGELSIEEEFTRAFSGDGIQRIQLIFRVQGPGTKKFAVFAQGPSLELEGVAGFLEDPQIQLIRDNTESIASNDDWQDDPNVAETQAVLTAKSFTLHPLDAALVRELPAGLYTVVVTGVGGGTGITRVGASDVDAILDSTTSAP